MTQTLPDTKPFANFEWKLALRYLRARRKEGIVSVISLISFLGIMLGVATLIVVMSVFNGFRQELLNKVLGFSGHASIYHPQFEPIPNWDQIKINLSKTPHVTQAIAIVEGQVMVSSTNSATGALVRGLSEEDIKKVAALNNENLRTAIRTPSGLDEQPSFDGWDKTDGVAIGERMAWKHQVGLGTPLTIISPNGPDTVMGNTPLIREYPVVAIFKMGMSEYDENVVYMPIKEAQNFFTSEDGVTGIELLVDRPDDIQSYLGDIRSAAGKDLMIQTWKDRNQAFFTALVVQQNVVFFVMTLVVLVAALNIISGLTMLVKNKSRDIAILRTMGVSAPAIMRIFFITGSAIGVVGTIVGTMVGLLLSWNSDNIRRFIQYITNVKVFDEEFNYLSQLPSQIEPTQVLSIVSLTLLLTFLATLYPSWRAAKLDPVEALRYE